MNAEVIYVSQDPKQAACILDFGINVIWSREDFWGFLFRQGVRRAIMSLAKFGWRCPFARLFTPTTLVTAGV